MANTVTPPAVPPRAAVVGVVTTAYGLYIAWEAGRLIRRSRQAP